MLSMPGILYPTPFTQLIKSSTARTYSDKEISFTSGFRVQVCLSKEGRVSSLLQCLAGEEDIKFSGQRT